MTLWSASGERGVDAVKRMCVATAASGLKARDVTAWGEAPGYGSQNDPSPEGAGQERGILCRPYRPASDSLQPRLSQDGPSALSSQVPTSRHATCNLTSRSGVMDLDELAAPENA